MMKKATALIFAGALALLPPAALAQGAVQQSGAVIAGDCTRWLANGIIADAGSSCSGSTSPGGSNSQVQWNNSGAFGGFTVGGDAALNPATGVLTVTKTNGSSFGAMATQGVSATGGDLVGAWPTLSVGSIGGFPVTLAGAFTTIGGTLTTIGNVTFSVTPSAVAISTSTFTPTGTFNNYSILLVHAACPCTLANPTATPVPGTTGRITIKQSSTGSDTIGTYGSVYRWPGGSAPTLSTAANATDLITYYVQDTTHVLLSSSLGYAQ